MLYDTDDISFNNIEFGETLISPTILKWKDHPAGIHAITSKKLNQSKYGPSYILELMNTEKKVSRVYTPKYVTEYLNHKNPKYIKLIKDGETNKAQFAD